MGWKKCINCELNLIPDDRDYCDYCISSSREIRQIVQKKEYEKQREIEQEEIRKEETLEKDYRDQLLELLNSFDFKGFLHTTNFENFLSIYRLNKILPRIKLNNIKFVDNANPEIINKTSDFLKKCVRFYYRPITPTNVSAYRDFNQKKQVILVLDKNEIYNKNAYFSDMNAKSSYARCSCKAKNALNYNWQNIFSNDILNEYDFFEKSERNAEFLIFGDVDLSKIIQIVFRTTFDMDEAIKILGPDKRFVVNSLMFYRGK